MNILLIIAAIFIATETINPNVDEGKQIQKKEVVTESVETKPSEEIISETQAAAAEAEAAAQAQAAAEAEEAAEKEINYLKIALYIILLLAVLSGALLYFRKRDKSPLESKIIPPERKEEQPVQAETQPEAKEEQPIQEETQPEAKEEQPIQEETQPEPKDEQPIDNVNKEPTNFEETNEDEKK